jgi:hypothetical protein
MLFFIKELIASAQDPNLIQNPFILTKLDMKTIEMFDFDEAQSKFFKKKLIKKATKKLETVVKTGTESDSD